MQLSNQLNLMYETDSVNTQVQILTKIFLLALDSSAPFEVKLIKRSPARWITEGMHALKNEINNKYMLTNEYKSIVDDAAKLQKETAYQQQKMVVRKLIKISETKHYHEALKNARTNPKDRLCWLCV